MQSYPNLEAYFDLQSQVSQGYLTWLLAVAILVILLDYAARRFPWRPLPFPIHLPLWSILLLGALLRLPTLLEPFWYDETFTAQLARLPFAQMWQVMLSDVHPPWWYILSWFNARLLGDSEVALRFPAFIGGLVLIYLVWRVAGNFGLNPQERSLAALLIALFPAMIYYSAEARPYSLLACGVVGMMICIQEFRPRLFLLAGLHTMASHNLGYFYFATLTLYALWCYQRWGAYRGRWAHFTALAGAVGGAWLPFALLQSRDISDGFWIPPLDLGGMLLPLTQMTTGWRMDATALLVSIGLFGGLCLWALRNWRVEKLWWLVALGVPLSIALISLAWHNVYLARALLGSAALLALPLARMLHQQRLMVVLMGLALLPALIGHYVYPRGDIGKVLQSTCSGHSPYVVNLPAGFVTAYYLRNPTLWPMANNLDQSLSLSAQEALGWDRNFLENMRGLVCVIDNRTPKTRSDESRYLERILAAHPYSTVYSEVGEDSSLRIYLVNLDG